MSKKENIDQFLNSRKIAIVGVSRDSKKFGYKVFEHLLKNGYEVFPVHPLADQIDRVTVYKDIASLPPECKSLLILTKPDKTDDIVRQAIEKKINNIWIQQMSDTKSSITLAKEHHINLISKECIFMFVEPVSGFHKFHRFFKRLSPGFPR